jgi:heme/copper-type cytochrome/quinol oxidase subunit 2
MSEILIIIMLVFLTAINVCYLFYFKNRAKKAIKIEEKDNYYKLDAKIEFQKYLILAVISVAAFFGINKFNDLSDTAKQITILETSYDNINKMYLEAQDNLRRIEGSYSGFVERLSKNEKELILLDFKIQDITRQLPEPNIKVIAKLLAQTYLTILLEHLTMMISLQKSQKKLFNY